MKAEGLDLSDIEKALRGMDLDRSVGALSHLYRGGTSEAKKLFRRFLEGSFDAYTGHRNQPQTDDVSHMSKYLHFRQIAPIWLALTARRARTKKDNIESFVEELIVRREVSMNFVLYTRTKILTRTCPIRRKRHSKSTRTMSGSTPTPESSWRVPRRMMSTGTRR
jgi:deoxyribodipyrimidine photo-lyase